MKLLIAALAVLCTSGVLAAQSPAALSIEPLALVNANLVNVRDGRVVRNATLVLRDGRIASIGSQPAASGVRPAVASGVASGVMSVT